MPWLRYLGETDFAVSSPQQGRCQGLVSNFGLEYVPRADVARACARWLAPEGRLSAVVHASGSVIDLTAAQSLDDLSHALSELALFDRAQDLLQAIRTLPADSARRQRHGAGPRAAYNRGVDDLKARMAERGKAAAVWMDMLTALTRLVRQALDGHAEAALAACAELAQAYRAEVIRLRAMRASAFGSGEQALLGQAFAQAGLTRPVWAEIRSPIGLVAWHLSARSAV